MDAAKLEEWWAARLCRRQDDKGAGVADPNAEYWTVAEIAQHWGVKVPTIRAYRSRNRGELPEPDRIYGRTPLWKPATIIGFERPGQGARTDLRDKSEQSGTEAAE
jgi:hypothetical protein